MPAFYLTLVAVLLAGLAARDQLTVAGLALRQGRRPMVLVVAVCTSVLTALLAGWLGTYMLAHFPPPARAIFASIAIAFAGLESLVLVAHRNPREPTNSLGALAVVLLAHQITDASRFIVFAMAVGMAAPVVSTAAGMLGGALLAGLAWSAPELIASPRARRLRRIVGLLLLLAALVLLLRQFGIL